MKTHKKIHPIILVTFASVLAPFASAQVTGAVDAAGRATAATQNAALSAQQSAAAATNANTAATTVSTNAANAAQVSAANAAQVSTNATSAAINSGANAAGAASVNASRPLSDGIGVNGAANTNASLNGQTNGRSVANSVSGGGAGSLNSTATVREIQGATGSTRGTVLTQVDSSINTSASAMANLRRSGRQLNGEDRAQEKTAKRSLNEARKAKDST